MQVNAALLRFPPMLRNGLVLVCLVDDLGDNLGPGLDQTRIGRWDVRTVDGIGGRILHQQAQERKDTPDQERDDQDVDQNEDDHTAPHCD